MFVIAKLARLLEARLELRVGGLLSSGSRGNLLLGDPNSISVCILN